ncbi:putative acetyltransferase [Beutenbergia cavernae DSM 12333]|uniref:Putative acetyltransferase n=1 Tax=Beutenbergia cavernae (strain ATCC BAA-8 / DSM 12333 / CCUG 43141 / JCM 11478 / NBRC 16432 / NCIMB 13614 / HKI 0122) TaxID=471853 RepID=C5C3K5_BEUC1|nr:GNAT family N-acetyltransferase [Beutenbergia cavernae]ACQ81914.1 putative acetyltransferase [Beutenbergia cavernae DSM 12333]
MMLTDVSRDVRLQIDGGTLVPLVPGHAPAMAEAVAESGLLLRETVPWYRDGMTVDDFGRWAEAAKTLWADGSGFVFSVLADSTGGFLGGASLEAVHAGRLSANLSYWTRAAASGRGVATRSARRLASWGCVDLGLQRIEVSIVTTNAASLAVAQNAGAVVEGTLRNAARWDGVSRDMAVFSFIPADFAHRQHG